MATVKRKREATKTSDAIVRVWHDDQGWGVLDSAETPGGCWTHFSVVQVDGYRALTAGQRVKLRWEAPGQDGDPFRAVNVYP